MNIFFRPDDDPRNRPGLFEFVCDVNGKPFAAMLSKALVEPFPNPDYTWLWTIQLACPAADPEFEMPAEDDLYAINSLAVRAFGLLHATLDILFVGTTIHRGNAEMMFLGREEDVAEIGGTLLEFPEKLGADAGRFLQFKSERDADWQQITGLYEVVRQFAS
jgi:hypothetical protein